MNSAPMIVNKRTNIEPVLTLDLSSLFIMAAPMIMIIPLTSPIPPTATTARPNPGNPTSPAKEPRKG